MRILVSGASGHVGTVVASHLTARGHDVVGLGRRPAAAGAPLAAMVTVDLGVPGAADRVSAEQPPCDAIVHAAAAIEMDPSSPQISLTNGLGTQQMLELAVRWGVASFVYVSSLPVIGRPRLLPVTEQHPVDPPTAYHASKLFGEQLLSVAHRAGTPAIALRLTSPVGPGVPDGRIVSVFVQRALAGDPLEVRDAGRGQDYVDVRDVATAVELAIARRAVGLLNIASGTCVTNAELAERCVAVLGSSSAVRLIAATQADDAVRWEVSIDAARAQLGYRPQYSIDQSISAVAEGRAG